MSTKLLPRRFGDDKRKFRKNISIKHYYGLSVLRRFEIVSGITILVAVAVVAAADAVNRERVCIFVLYPVGASNERNLARNDCFCSRNNI